MSVLLSLTPDSVLNVGIAGSLGSMVSPRNMSGASSDGDEWQNSANKYSDALRQALKLAYEGHFGIDLSGHSAHGVGEMECPKLAPEDFNLQIILLNCGYFQSTYTGFAFSYFIGGNVILRQCSLVYYCDP